MIHAFAFYNTITGAREYFVLDVESGAIHMVDEAAYAVACAIEQGGDSRALPIQENELQEILDEFAALRGQGMFLSPEIEVPAKRESPVIKSLCLHVAHDCNLRCKYCFADTGEFHGERMLMPLEIGKAALDFLMVNCGSRRNLEVDLFGGEPLVNFEVVRGIVAYGRELEKKHEKVIHFTLTTNGLALNEEKIAYINSEMHNVVLSLDGRKRVHDDMRPTVNGKGSYDAILPRMQALVRARGQKEYYVRGTFTSKNLDFAEDVLALRDAGFEQISVEPVVLEKRSPYAIQEEHVPAILAEYDRLSALMQQNEREGKWFNFFHFMLDMEDGPCLQKRLKGCGAGVEYAAISPEGDIYPCHQFVGDAEYKMGNVLEGTCSETIRRMFQACNLRTKPACKGCWAKYFCSGGCAANAWKINGDIMRPEEISCTLLKKRTECAIALAMTNKLEGETNEEQAL